MKLVSLPLRSIRARIAALFSLCAEKAEKSEYKLPFHAKKYLISYVLYGIVISAILGKG